MRQRHNLIQIKPEHKIFNFLYGNITYQCRLCGEIIKGNMGKNPNEHHKNCQNYEHFCNEEGEEEYDESCK